MEEKQKTNFFFMQYSKMNLQVENFVMVMVIQDFY